MAKVNLVLPNGTKVTIEGAKEEVAELLELYHNKTEKSKEEESSGGTNRKRNTQRKKPSKNKAKNSKISPLDKNKEPSITLTEDHLKSMKEYFSDKAYKSGRKLIFKVCYFLANKMKKERFGTGDVILVYESLIPLRIKVPVLNHIHQTLLDMCSKSKKIMWLENHGDGYFSISRIGKIHWLDIQNEA